VSGILDKKKRILDFIITEEGRNQSANGELRVHYASFSDSGAFYTEKSGSFAEDISNRIHFEVNVRPQDALVLENPPVYASDTKAKHAVLKPFQTSDFKIAGTNIAKASASGKSLSNMLTGSAVSSFANNVCSSLSQNFKDMQIIGTLDPFDDSSGFEIFPESKTFEFSEESSRRWGRTTSAKADVRHCESLFQDPRLGHIPNYMYMPPVNKTTDGQDTKLGRYPNLNKRRINGLSDLMAGLAGKTYVDFDFSETSRENNILVQPIEFRDDGIKKLAVIDFGEFQDNDPESPGRRVFFVGKIYSDADGNSTYINIFTVMMD
jgi:hypothetical protein